MMQDSLSRVINTLGEESAAEQGLTKVITTTEKLRNSPTHLLYLLKDAHAKGFVPVYAYFLSKQVRHLWPLLATQPI